MPLFNFNARLGSWKFSFECGSDRPTGNRLKFVKVGATDPESTDKTNHPEATSAGNACEATNLATQGDIILSDRDIATLEKILKRAELTKAGSKPEQNLPNVRKIFQDKCPLFKTIPTEIRQMIYKNVLVTDEPLMRAHELISGTSTIMVCSYERVGDIDARLLRTCREIYEDCMPILYGGNTFSFHLAAAVRTFKDEGIRPPYFTSSMAATQQELGAIQASNSSGNIESPLVDLPSYHGQFLNSMPFGRLTLLRSVDLQMGSTFWDPRNNLMPMAPRTPDREQIWREWSANFFQRPAHSIFLNDSERIGQCAFPALEHLTLDFTIWELQKSDGIFVRPFIERLRPTRGIKHLTIKGVKCQRTLENFRIALLSEGGKFEVVN